MLCTNNIRLNNIHSALNILANVLPINAYITWDKCSRKVINR